jgi:CheY-like chemotaxis protein
MENWAGSLKLRNLSVFDSKAIISESGKLRDMPKVLLIEDDPIVCRVYSQFLAANGFSVTTERDGAKGVASLCADRPDAVILDLMLPGMSGLKVLTAIRADDALKNLPVLVFTAAHIPALVNEALSLGVVRVFDKSNTKPLAVTQCLHDILGTSCDAKTTVLSNSGNIDPRDSRHVAPNTGL